MWATASDVRIVEVSLRVRLVAGLAVVASIGLSVAGVATYLALESHLVDRVDQQLTVLRSPLRSALGDAGVVGLQIGEQVDSSAERLAVPPGAYGELRERDGATRIAASHSTVAGETGVPVLPDQLPGSGAPRQRVVFSTAAVDASSGPSRYRVLAEPLPNGGTFVAAVPLDDAEDTLAQLVELQLAISTAVLVAVALAGWLFVGRSMKPLEEIADTADAITAGDLDRRVPTTGVPSEVARVGSAMNTMLGRIGDAFDEQQASEERLRRFVADASHELRTPLTSIRGYAELFRRGADRRSEDLATAMRRIEQEAERMGLLVEHLLLLARLDEHPELDRVPVDLSRMAVDVVADARVAHPDRPIDLEVGDDVVVAGDEGQLRQVLGNLVTNALVHTPAEVQVAVRLRRDDGKAVLEVADRGPGLDAEVAPHVFERFNRGDPARARATGGTGLGLAIVSAVVEAHGGLVELVSAPDEGATFVVRLPLADTET